MVHLCQSEPSCFWNDAPGPEGGEEADEGEGEEGGRDAQGQAKVWHHLGCQYVNFEMFMAMGCVEHLLSRF